jgi:rubredoxin
MALRNIACPVCGEEKDFYMLVVAEGNRGAPFIASRHHVVLCKNCGLCFLNPQHDEADYAKYYEFYDRPVGRKIGPKGFRPDSLRSEYDRIRLDFLTQFLPDKNAKIIDIGSGYGLF